MKTVLSVDDEVSILQCIRRALGSAGYKVITTTDATEAIDIISKQELDLITLDVKMPKMNGLEAYKIIKEKQKDALPVLFLTGYPTTFALDTESMMDMWNNEFSDGNTDMLYKPFDINVLIGKVEGLIGPAEESPE